MNRHILLVTNPGEIGATNYCQGVNVDAINYRAFFQSPAGGYWDAMTEITHLNRPAATELQRRITLLKDKNYLKVIFCGHGYHCTTRNTTMLELSHGNEIDHRNLINAGQSQTIIMDCCRVRHPGVVKEAAFEARASIARGPMNGPACRESYNAHLRNCSGRIKIYSCGIGEKAGDNAQSGGVYSAHLIRTSIAWSETRIGAGILEVPIVHELAKQATQADKPEQNAVIEKDRSGPYFPFAVTIDRSSLIR